MSQGHEFLRPGVAERGRATERRATTSSTVQTSRDKSYQVDIDQRPWSIGKSTSNAATSALGKRTEEQDFSQIPMHRNQPERPQSKLAVLAPDDALEQEAVHVADRVLGTTDQMRTVQRSPECGPMQRIPMKSASRSVMSAEVGNVVNSSGNTLDSGTRAFMEPRFGHDFSGVRVHSGRDAVNSVREVNALAYTVGNHIVLGVGMSSPETREGRRLLAHELTHVLQQTNARDDRMTRPALETLGDARSLHDTAGLALQRQVIPGSTEARKKIDEGQLPKTTVKKHAIVYKHEGVRLRERPTTESAVLKLLPFNTRVFVDSESNGWCYVSTDTGDIGYCATSHLEIGPPEPNAIVHWIAPGETALGISRQYYGGETEWGSDHRFFINGLIFVNAGPGPRGIYKPRAADDWDDSQVRLGFRVWIPSAAFLKGLRGKVKSGSITYEAVQATVNVLETAAEFVIGAAAFIAGLLHGALESLWDVLVGLKDLVVLIWDVVKSLLTLHLLKDASELWNQLKAIDWGELVQGWITNFLQKWNAPPLLERWHFRGWVAGYAIMEALLLFFSGGVIQGIKWVGKASKVSKIVAGLPKVAEFIEAVKGSKAAQRLSAAVRHGAQIAETAPDAIRWISRILVDPKQIWGKSPEQIADVFRKAGREAIVEQSTKGSKLSKQIRISRHDISRIEVHPGGGRHKGSYYSISSSSKGKIKIVDRLTYEAAAAEKATITFMDGGNQGWLIQAVAANSAIQHGVNAVPLGSDDDE